MVEPTPVLATQARATRQHMPPTRPGRDTPQPTCMTATTPLRAEIAVGAAGTSALPAGTPETGHLMADIVTAGGGHRKEDIQGRPEGRRGATSLTETGAPPPAEAPTHSIPGVQLTRLPTLSYPHHPPRTTTSHRSFLPQPACPTRADHWPGDPGASAATTKEPPPPPPPMRTSPAGAPSGNRQTSLRKLPSSQRRGRSYPKTWPNGYNSVPQYSITSSYSLTARTASETTKASMHSSSPWTHS